ncbi:MAG: TldD/PmbA family protein [Clostridia bacterium]|nr:TldD/PmbA family protein [Clostridia bacterium]
MKFDDVKDFLIAEAERLGLREYEVYYMESADMNAETLKNEISSFSSGVRGGVCFRCIVDGHMGSASGELLEEDEMRALVSRAVENAKNIESDDKAILYKGSDSYAKVELPDVPNMDAAQVKKLALEMQKNTYETSEYITDGTQSAVFTSKINTQLMNSHGLRLSNSVAMSGAYVQAVIQKDGEAQDDFDWTLDVNDEKSIKAVSASAVDKAISKVGAIEVDTGKYDIIISGKKMGDLLSAYSSSFSAKQAQLGMSMLKGKEGQKVASDIVTLIDDPMRQGCPMQTSFDGEGVAAYKKNVIECGTLNTLLYDLSTADKAGKESTGNGQRLSYSNSVSIAPYSFYIEKGSESLDDLLKKVGDGLYITEFKGMHAGCNGVTGDFSIESAGYLIKDGRLCESVRSFTVAGNFFTLLKNIEALSDNVKFGIPSGFTCYGSPDVLLRNMSIAGK